ncbi:hypothetical protein Tco_0313494 [Tanacetum coccineum]
MGVMMELHQGECFWPATREVAREGGGDDKEGDGEGGNEGVGGFAEVYRNMSAGESQSLKQLGFGVTRRPMGKAQHLDGATRPKSQLDVIFDEKKLGSS